MNIAFWIVAALLALVYLAAGVMKLAQSQRKLGENENLGWTQDVSAGAIKAIGAVELLGAIGVIVPKVTGIVTVLTPLAAAGLAIVQIGALIVHLRRHETKSLPVNILLFAMAVFVAVVGFTG
jgi:uncharacterized membrane protein YphA (DoxX/SURF4 family)